jgi:flavin reductase (DIM6/NTAB) family NADH-FMN oxidoreductase RutF
MDGNPTIMTGQFDPADHPRLFRAALGAFATGVTVVTTRGPDGPVGMTANSFASVSLDPPLVLWSPARASGRFALFAQAARFAVHVLAADQRPVADGFATSWTGPAGLDWDSDALGLPLFGGALARFQCDTVARHDGGDHLVIIGRVTAVDHAATGQPLVFQGGRWGTISPAG